MKPEELADVEVLLEEFPTLQIAYIDEADDLDDLSCTPVSTPRDTPAGSTRAQPARPRGRLFYSCLVDASCELDAATGRRRPRFRVRLPGHPILGNGKSDNQNHAIIFSRGVIIQAIDANQEG